MSEIPTDQEMRAAIVHDNHIKSLEHIIHQRAGELEIPSPKRPVISSNKSLKMTFREDVIPYVETMLGATMNKHPRIRRTSKKHINAVISTLGIGACGSALAYTFTRDWAVTLATAVSASIVGGNMLGRRIWSECRHKSYYDNTANTIFYSPFSIWPAQPVLAHEVTHAIQYQNLSKEVFDFHNAFMEGMAIGIERAIWNAHKDQIIGAPLIKRIRLNGVVDAYLQACAMTETSANRNILRMRKQNDQEIASTLTMPMNQVQYYGIGDALFAIAELKHGPGIYAEALRNPRVVLE